MQTFSLTCVAKKGIEIVIHRIEETPQFAGKL